MPQRVQSAAASSAFAVTPSDVTVIAAEALYIGVTGNLTVVTVANETIQFKNVPVGIFPIRCTKVTAATTATEIVGMKY